MNLFIWIYSLSSLWSNAHEKPSVFLILNTRLLHICVYVCVDTNGKLHCSVSQRKVPLCSLALHCVRVCVCLKSQCFFQNGDYWWMHLFFFKCVVLCIHLLVHKLCLFVRTSALMYQMYKMNQANHPQFLTSILSIFWPTFTQWHQYACVSET